MHSYVHKLVCTFPNDGCEYIRRHQSMHNSLEDVSIESVILAIYIHYNAIKSYMAHNDVLQEI